MFALLAEPLFSPSPRPERRRSLAWALARFLHPRA